MLLIGPVGRSLNLPSSYFPSFCKQTHSEARFHPFSLSKGLYAKEEITGSPWGRNTPTKQKTRSNTYSCVLLRNASEDLTSWAGWSLPYSHWTGLSGGCRRQLWWLAEAYSNGDSNCSAPQNVIYLLEQIITISGTLYKPADTVNTFCSNLKNRQHEKEFVFNWMGWRRAFTVLS